MLEMQDTKSISFNQNIIPMLKLRLQPQILTLHACTSHACMTCSRKIHNNYSWAFYKHFSSMKWIMSIFWPILGLQGFENMTSKLDQKVKSAPRILGANNNHTWLTISPAKHYHSFSPTENMDHKASWLQQDYYRYKEWCYCHPMLQGLEVPAPTRQFIMINNFWYHIHLVTLMLMSVVITKEPPWKLILKKIIQGMVLMEVRTRWIPRLLPRSAKEIEK